jgi:hypothetical protein
VYPIIVGTLLPHGDMPYYARKKQNTQVPAGPTLSHCRQEALFGVEFIVIIIGIYGI